MISIGPHGRPISAFEAERRARVDLEKRVSALENMGSSDNIVTLPKEKEATDAT